MARLLRIPQRNTPPPGGEDPRVFASYFFALSSTNNSHPFQEWVSLNFDLFSSGFVSTNPEPRCVTIQKIQTDPLPIFPMVFEFLKRSLR